MRGPGENPVLFVYSVFFDADQKKILGRAALGCAALAVFAAEPSLVTSRRLKFGLCLKSGDHCSSLRAGLLTPHPA